MKLLVARFFFVLAVLLSAVAMGALARSAPPPSCNDIPSEGLCSSSKNCAWCRGTSNSTNKTSCSYCIDTTRETCCTSSTMYCPVTCKKTQKCFVEKYPYVQGVCCAPGKSPCMPTRNGSPTCCDTSGGESSSSSSSSCCAGNNMGVCCSKNATCCGYGSDIPTCCAAGHFCQSADHLQACCKTGAQIGCSDNENAWCCGAWQQCGYSYGGLDCFDLCTKLPGFTIKPNSGAILKGSFNTTQPDECCSNCQRMFGATFAGMYEFTTRGVCYCFSGSKAKIVPTHEKKIVFKMMHGPS